MVEVIELTLIGLAVGLTGGLFGIGGGIVLIPALTLLYGPDQHRYHAVALIVNFFVAVPAVYQHLRAGAIHARTVAWLIPPAILGVLTGVFISEAPAFSGPGEAWLRLIFAGFLLLAAGLEGMHTLRPVPVRLPGNGNGSPVSMSLSRILAVAAPTGLVSGLLGVGGGVVAVPLQRRLLHAPLRNAIANSAAVIIATSIFGAFTKNYAYYNDHGGSWAAVILAITVGPIAVAGSLVGSHLTHRLRLNVLRLLFSAFLVLAAIRIGAGAVQELRDEARLSTEQPVRGA